MNPGCLEQPFEPEAPNPLRRPRVKGHDDGHLGRNLGDGFEQSAENALVVDVLGPMQGEKRIVRGDPEALRGAAGTRRIGGAKRVSIMTLPTKTMRSAGIPSWRRFSSRVAARGQEEIGEAVGQDAVDLFRHPPIAAAEAGLDVGDLLSRST